MRDFLVTDFEPTEGALHLILTIVFILERMLIMLGLVYFVLLP